MTFLICSSLIIYSRRWALTEYAHIWGELCIRFHLILDSMAKHSIIIEAMILFRIEKKWFLSFILDKNRTLVFTFILCTVHKFVFLLFSSGGLYTCYRFRWTPPSTICQQTFRIIGFCSCFIKIIVCGIDKVQSRHDTIVKLLRMNEKKPTRKRNREMREREKKPSIICVKSDTHVIM